MANGFPDIFETNNLLSEFYERKRAQAAEAKKNEPLTSRIENITKIFARLPQGLSPITLSDDTPRGLHIANEITKDINAKLSEMSQVHEALLALYSTPNSASKDQKFAEQDKKYVELHDGLRKDVLDLSTQLQSPHLHPFFADENERKQTSSKINALRSALNARRPGEDFLSLRRTNISRDKNWAAIPAHDAFSPNSARFQSEESCIIFTYEPNKGFWNFLPFNKDDTTQHNFKHMSEKRICRTVDFMKNADAYIALWRGKLAELKKDPLNPELKKYQKYEPLLKHLEECKKKGLTNDSIIMTKNLSGDMRLSCGTVERKNMMMETLIKFDHILEEEKNEKEKTHEASAEVDLLPAPRM